MLKITSIKKGKEKIKQATLIVCLSLAAISCKNEYNNFEEGYNTLNEEKNQRDATSSLDLALTTNEKLEKIRKEQRRRKQIAYAIAMEEYKKENRESWKEILTYDIPIYDEEFQYYIMTTASKWGVKYTDVFTIIHLESNGTWATNGVESKTHDFGLAQINKRNIPYITKKLGYTQEDIQYDPYKNIDAMCFLIATQIYPLYDFSEEYSESAEILGTYNGYSTWRHKKNSRNYVELGLKLLEEKYKPFTIYTDGYSLKLEPSNENK